MTENVEKIITFAPGEVNKPLGIFIDKESEFLSFPTIYCGKTPAYNKDRTTPVHYNTICKWELRSQDRRVPCKNNPILFLFYVYFNAIVSILYYFILSDLYFIPILPDRENRATILIVVYFYFKA